MTTEKKGFEKYSDAILTIARQQMMLESKNSFKALGEVLQNTILDGPGPRRIQKQWSKKELIFGGIFRAFTEIFKSFERIKQIKIFMRAFPYKNQKISKVDYLAYQIEAFLNETYILKERLISNTKIIDRIYRHRKREVCPVTDRLRRMIHASFKNAADVRGRHIHQTRYTDGDLDRITTIELIATPTPPIKDLEKFYLSEYRRLRHKWVKNVTDNEKNIKLILDKYFEDLYKIVVNKDGEIQS